jgi:5-methylcytosine-specific restriction endonuclease McrA
LELERKKPNESYDNTDNLVLCCYWCNNAKTDEFTEEEFKEIGKVIGKIWQTRLQRIPYLKTEGF